LLQYSGAGADVHSEVITFQKAPVVRYPLSVDYDFTTTPSL